MNNHKWGIVEVHSFNIGKMYTGWSLRIGGLKIEYIWMKHKWNLRVEISHPVEW